MITPDVLILNNPMNNGISADKANSPDNVV